MHRCARQRDYGRSVNPFPLGQVRLRVQPFAVLSHKMRSAKRRPTATGIALAVCLVSCLWTLWLPLFGGIDTVVLGARVRATDPVDSGLLAIIAFGVFVALRRRKTGQSLALVETSVRLGIRLRPLLPIGAILLIAGIARFWGLGFGLPHTNARPDEGAVGSIAGGIYHGDIVPDIYNYPPFFMLAVALAMALWSAVSWLVFVRSPALLARFGIRVPTLGRRHPANPVTERVIGRVLSAAAGVGTVLVVYLAGTRLFGRRAGMSAAACLSLAFLHVGDSHFGVTDIPMTFMLCLAFSRIVTHLVPLAT